MYFPQDIFNIILWYKIEFEETNCVIYWQNIQKNKKHLPFIKNIKSCLTMWKDPNNQLFKIIDHERFFWYDTIDDKQFQCNFCPKCHNYDIFHTQNLSTFKQICFNHDNWNIQLNHPDFLLH